MKWPKLVQPWMCSEKIEIYLTHGLGMDGVPAQSAVIHTTCNFSEKMRQVLDAERRLVTLEGTVLINGDIAPDTAQLSGWVSLRGVRREIFRAERGRNPDGSVNYTRLELM